MLVSDVINDAKYGELQQLAIKNDDAAILSFLNLGVLELYKRFCLRTEEAIVSLSAIDTIYPLDPALPNVDMVSDCDLLYIIGIYDEDGNIVEMNNEDEPLSVLTPSYDTLQVPNPADNTYLSVIYSATPTRLVDTTSKLKLPPSLYEALLHYIGYRGHGSIDGNTSTENNTHYMRFDKSCEAARAYGLVTADEIPYRRVTVKGFL
jgi:hypothetical protein